MNNGNKPNFKLPNTTKCVVAYKDLSTGEIKKVIIDTPPNTAMLFQTMLMNHRVGYGQIRTVMAHGASKLIDLGRINPNHITIGTFGRNTDRLEPMFA